MGAIKLHTSTWNYPFKKVLKGGLLINKNPVQEVTNQVCVPTGSGSRFMFNGKEQDPEMSGEGNSYDYGFRIYNPRLGRFLSVDPFSKAFPWYTPYQYAGNKPIFAVDLDGTEDVEYQVIGYNIRTGATIIRLYRKGDSDANSNSGQLLVHSAATGKVYNYFPFSIYSGGTSRLGEFDMAFQIGSVPNPTVVLGPSSGNYYDQTTHKFVQKDYFFKIDPTDPIFQNSENRPSDSKFYAGTFEVFPVTPSWGFTGNVPSGPDALGHVANEADIVKSVSPFLSTFNADFETIYGQKPTDILEVNVTIPQSVLTDNFNGSYSQLQNTLQTTYPNATINVTIDSAPSQSIVYEIKGAPEKIE